MENMLVLTLRDESAIQTMGSIDHIMAMPASAYRTAYVTALRLPRGFLRIT
jgi:hypothetical protein